MTTEHNQSPFLGAGPSFPTDEFSSCVKRLKKEEPQDSVQQVGEKAVLKYRGCNCSLQFLWMKIRCQLVSSLILVFMAFHLGTALTVLILIPF